MVWEDYFREEDEEFGDCYFGFSWGWGYLGDYSE